MIGTGKPNGNVKRQLMAEQWDQFSREAFKGTEIGSIQRQEMRRAFYAGAQAILFKIKNSMSIDGEPTEQDIQMMAGVYQELQDFAERVKDGRA